MTRWLLLLLFLPAISFAQNIPQPLAVKQHGVWTNACTQSGTWSINNITGTVPLPTGAASSANQSTIISHVDGIETLLGGTLSVGGTVTANAGTNLNTSLLALESGGNLAALVAKDFATQTTLAALNAKFVTGTDIGDVTINNASGGSAVNVQDGGNSLTVDAPVGTPVFVRLSDGSSAITTLPVSLASVPSHAVTEDNSASMLTALQLIDNIVSGAGVNITQLNGVNVTMGNGSAGTGVQRVTIADDSTGQVKLAAGTAGIGKLTANSGVDIGDVDVTSLPRSSTCTTTSVAGSASSVTLLSTNSNRLGATIFNDSTAILYVKLGTTASTSSFQYKVYPEQTVEIPYGYTGRIDGIWASAAGNARIGEFT